MIKTSEQLKRDYESLWESVVQACIGSGCINAHELRVALDAERLMNKALRNEVEAWREFDKSCGNDRSISRRIVQEAMDATNASGALKDK